MAHQPQVVLFEPGLHLVEAFLHLAAIGEQREHRSPLRPMGVGQKPLQSVEVARVVRLGHVFGHVHRHLSVEIVARIQAAHAACRELRSIQAKRRLESVEAIVHHQRRGREHHRMRAREQRVVHSRPHVHQQRFKLLGHAIFLAAERGGVGIGLVGVDKNDVNRFDLVFQLYGERGHLALHLGCAVKALEVADQLLACRHQLLGSGGQHLPQLYDLGKRCALTYVAVDPQLDRLVALPFFILVEE